MYTKNFTIALSQLNSLTQLCCVRMLDIYKHTISVICLELAFVHPHVTQWNILIDYIKKAISLNLYMFCQHIENQCH